MTRPLRIQFPGALYHITSRQTEGTRETAWRQHYAARPSLSELFGKGSVDAETLMCSQRTYRYTLKEIGGHLGIHYHHCHNSSRYYME